MAEVRLSAGGVVLNPEGMVLVVSQQKGTSWSLPKGGVEEGEDLVAAAKREIHEEAGVTELEYVKPLGTYDRYKIGKDGGDDQSQIKRMNMFLFRTKQRELKPLDENNPEARWFHKDEVENVLTHRKDKEFFAGIKAAI